MKAKISDIIPGNRLWYVCCVCGVETQYAKVSHEIIVTSYIHTNNSCGYPQFDCVSDFRGFGFDWHNFNDHHFLGDCGMPEAIGKEPVIYNLHRLFTTLESAQAYVIECKTGKFTDPEDQAFYDKTSTSKYQQERDVEFDWMLCSLQWLQETPTPTKHCIKQNK